MSEKLNRDFSRYEAMETEELEEILRLDAEAPEGAQLDAESILYILQVLATRTHAKNITVNTAQESWESFQKNYLDEEDAEDIQEPEKKRTSAPWLRRMIAAAAVVVLMVCIPLSAKAFGWEGLWNVFARWARETFSFVSVENTDTPEPDAGAHGAITSFQELLELGHCDPSIIPTWVPEGFVLEKFERDTTPVRDVFWAAYINGDRVLRIRVQNYSSTVVQYVEIGEDFSEIYTVSGVTYYIFENLEQLQVVWIVDSYECMISGDISVEEAKKMIDSIEKG